MKFLNGYSEAVIPATHLTTAFLKAESKLNNGDPVDAFHPDFAIHNLAPDNCDAVAFLGWACPKTIKAALKAIESQGGKPRGIAMAGFVLLRRPGEVLAPALDVMSFQGGLAIDLWRLASNGSGFNRSELGRIANIILTNGRLAQSLAYRRPNEASDTKQVYLCHKG